MSKNDYMLNAENGNFTCNGVTISVYDDNYPSGHQAGIQIIMNDRRVAANGDLRLEQTPGQWQPVPKRMNRSIDPQRNSTTVTLHYPDIDAHLKGFNPILYPDLEINYDVRVVPQEEGVQVTVDLDRPIPEHMAGKICFQLELTPVHLFGKPWIMDDTQDIFPRQPNGPTLAKPANYDIAGLYPDHKGNADPDFLAAHRRSYSPIVADDIIAAPYACGHCFTLRPDDDLFRLTVISKEEPLYLYDGRMNHNNGWFVLNSEIPTGKTTAALTWQIIPHADPDWRYAPVIETSQVGYHPAQEKVALIEIDSRSISTGEAKLMQITPTGPKVVRSAKPEFDRPFLRYHYLRFDFSDIVAEGLYCIQYQNSRSSIFRIAKDVYDRGVWQPVLEYFLPVQMCHMRVQEKYRVWHGHCHKDDAIMAPVNFNHFDGYYQGPSTLTAYQPGDHVPGLNAGGWHDAGDYDLRIESQSGEVYNLCLAYEEFHVNYDATTIDQENHLVEIHQPDGKNDILQQIEHGLLSIIGGYRSLGRLYRGIICQDLRQYVLLGDASVMTDGTPSEDDRFVFTENNPQRELSVAAQLAAAARAMTGYNDELAAETLAAARTLYEITDETSAMTSKAHAAIELFLTTKEERYRTDILRLTPEILRSFEHIGWIAVRVLPGIKDDDFANSLRRAAITLHEKYVFECSKTPYGVPYGPGAWGSGWGIQAFGAHYYYLHQAYPDIYPLAPITNALNFVLGCHPGTNPASFASGVGAVSATTAYGANRADYSYIPGGVISGTELIRPDFPELLEYPFLWQQGEYVLGGGSSNYLFLVLAVQHLLNK